MKTPQPLCGIDEAGRGPLAGPLIMAGVILHASIDGLDDSKKLTQKRREALFDLIIEHSRYHIVRFDAAQIDSEGLSACLGTGLQQIMHTLGEADYLFDGNSTFGAEGLRTQIKADAEVAEVAAASILAKVTRDREMVKMAVLYPQYGFERHKGYGAKTHIDAIREHGYCEIHRRSFRIKALEATLFSPAP